MVREIPDWLAGRLDREGLAKIEQVVSEAETKTSGEIVPFLIKRCVRNAAAPYLLSLVVLLLLLSAKHTLFLLGYPIFHDLAWSVLIVVLVVIGYSLGHLHWFELRLMPHHERMRQVSERAMLEFYREHLDGTKGRTGILLFLSLAERRAVVLADESIAKYYGEDAFDAVVAEMISGAKSGDLAEGFSKAVVRSRELLTPYFPPEGSNPNELKDHLRIRSN